VPDGPALTRAPAPSPGPRGGNPGSGAVPPFHRPGGRAGPLPPRRPGAAVIHGEALQPYRRSYSQAAAGVLTLGTRPWAERGPRSRDARVSDLPPHWRCERSVPLGISPSPPARVARKRPETLVHACVMAVAVTKEPDYTGLACRASTSAPPARPAASREAARAIDLRCRVVYAGSDCYATVTRPNWRSGDARRRGAASPSAAGQTVADADSDSDSDSAAQDVVPGSEGPGGKENQGQRTRAEIPGPKSREMPCLPKDREFSSGGREKYRRQ
jgi:hypothetical protein